MNNKKAISFEMMEKIVAKAKADAIKSIYIYNWTEPLLHPKIGSFISLIENAGIACGVSSNLNITKNINQAIRANPSFFRISLSGFNQEVYEKGHAGGDVELVKRNMFLLAELKNKYKSKTIIEVYYHRYLDNIAEESAMRIFAKNLGFKFSSAFATMMPLEKTLAVAEKNTNQITEQDIKVLQRIALPPQGETLELSKKLAYLPCNLREEMLVLDCAGKVVLCRTIFDQNKYAIGNYLELDLSEIQHRKNSLPSCTDMCNKCMSNGLHVYAQHPHTLKFEEIAIKAAMSHYHDLLRGIPDKVTLNDGTMLFKLEFNEQEYLATHSDVAAAVANRNFLSGYEHFVKFGRYEERRGWKKIQKKNVVIKHI